jgi:Arc/MetJ-type ribon-helix-helix transcriptional regulator
MNVAFELPAAQAEKLERAAERLGISPSELARAALSDLLADRDEDFRAAAERVLSKNAELYRRLA